MLLYWHAYSSALWKKCYALQRQTLYQYLQRGYSAIFFAVKKENRALVKLLVKAGADVEKPSKVCIYKCSVILNIIYTFMHHTNNNE